MWFALSSASQNCDRNTDITTSCRCVSVPETCSEEALSCVWMAILLPQCLLVAGWQLLAAAGKHFLCQIKALTNFYSFLCLLDWEIYHQESTNKSHFCIWVFQHSQWEAEINLYKFNLMKIGKKIYPGKKRWTSMSSASQGSLYGHFWQRGVFPCL